MGSITSGLATHLLDGVFWANPHNLSITSPLKLALMTTNGTATVVGTEVAGGSYARQDITFDPAWYASSMAHITNAAALNFTLMPACTVVGVTVYDNAGTRLFWQALDSPAAIAAGQTFSIGAGELTIRLA